ncbi:MAG: hypothetical protein H7331_02760 [Bacteroidia bacterium]|nr:hypothetical protein [Bacteroidia bacterium]
MKIQLFTSLMFISITLSSVAIAQTENIIKVEINNNAYMCPNLSMKIKRTVNMRKTDITNWKVTADFSSATFTASNAICNKDSIIKIFTKEAEFPINTINLITINGNEVYKTSMPKSITPHH